jgi:SAM-dependent methyltransferase
LSRRRPLLSRVKYWVSRPIGPRTYWDLMGRFQPVGAVTSGHDDLDDSMASGAAVVALMDALGLVDPDAVTLHIGSGLGRVEKHLHRRVRKCYGIDISPSMVRRAKELVPAENVEFVSADDTGLGRWADGTFDLVYSFLVFQHLPRQEFHRYLGEAHAKLADGGHLVFQIMIDETGSAPEPPPSHPYGIRYYTRAEVGEGLRQAGFEHFTRCDLGGRDDDAGVAVGDVVFCARKGP